MMQSSMTAVKTSTGTDLYLYGSQLTDSLSAETASGEECNLFVLTVPGATHEFQPDFGPLVFSRFYDGDIINGATATSSMRPSGSSVGSSQNWEVRLCSNSLLPCSLQFVNAFDRQAQSIVCQASDGCTGIALQNVVVQCDPNVMAPSAPFQVSGAGAALRIEGSTFTDCRSMEDGGAVRAYDGATVNISGSTFQRSASQGNGGAAALLGARATVNGTRFEACTSGKSGGAAFSGQYLTYPDVSRDSVVLWEGCTFEANTASQSGGALAAEAQSVVTVRKNCIFTGNSAAKGGALSVDTQSVVVLEDATIVSNTADEGGGMMLANASAVIQGSRLDGNTAQGPIGGAALRVSASTVELFNNIFTNNVAENGGGGAILWDGKQSETMSPIVHLPAPADSTFVVTFTVTMPYTTSEFDIAKQSKYKAAVASAAGTVAANVDILSITGTRRRAGKVDVETKIRSLDAAGVDAVSNSLGSGDALRSKIDQKLMEQGLQASAVKPAPGGKPCFARITLSFS
jgi:predicted outer membrane repeat protein